MLQYVDRFKEFADYKGLKTKEDIINVTAKDIEDFLKYLTDKGNGANSRKVKLAQIKEVFKYIRKENKEIRKLIDEEIFEIVPPKVPKRKVKFLDEEDAIDFISFIGNLRTKAMCQIMYNTCVRFCELIQITTDDIERGYAYVIGKGNKERRIDFSPLTIEIAKKYINNYRKGVVERNNLNTNLLFVTRNGLPVKSTHFDECLKSNAKRFNESPLYSGRLDWWQHFSAHKIRHAGATAMANNGTPLNVVRDILGHDNVTTTNTYVHTSDKVIRETMINNDSKLVRENML